MIKQKRGKLISRIIFLALVAVIILFGFLVISNLQLFSSEDGFTGAAISITPNEELNQVSEQIELIDDNSTVNGNESLTETNLISQGTLGIQVVANATQCGTVNGSITLTADVSATGTCFTINATSVTIDCAGYSINYSTAGTLGYGVDNSVGFDGYESVTIKNCNIYEGNLSTSSKFAIYFLDAGNALIENNNITTIGSASFGIYFWVSSSTNMISNTITTSNNDGIGIKIRSTQSSNFTDNKINTGGSYGGYGISVPSSTSNIFTNNTINTNSLEGYGILFSNSDSNILINNTISTSGTDSYGINMNTGNDFNILTNNTINTNGTSGYGIRFY
ncbi:MAG: right-handed parallel beta-helix repeat-containing protein, partial [Nanoarchaeota archaeon]|nr:right-handed parallel beta-helix repeat-containing protein [Nanoarchaeota archaeon]